MSKLPNCPYLNSDGDCALTGDFEDCPEEHLECDFFKAYRKCKCQETEPLSVWYRGYRWVPFDREKDDIPWCVDCEFYSHTKFPCINTQVEPNDPLACVALSGEGRDRLYFVPKNRKPAPPKNRLLFEGELPKDPPRTRED